MNSLNQNKSCAVTNYAKSSGIFVENLFLGRLLNSEFTFCSNCWKEFHFPGELSLLCELHLHNLTYIRKRWRCRQDGVRTVQVCIHWVNYDKLVPTLERLLANNKQEGIRKKEQCMHLKGEVYGAKMTKAGTWRHDSQSRWKSCTGSCHGKSQPLEKVFLFVIFNFICQIVTCNCNAYKRWESPQHKNVFLAGPNNKANKSIVRT